MLLGLVLRFFECGDGFDDIVYCFFPGEASPPRTPPQLGELPPPAGGDSRPRRGGVREGGSPPGNIVSFFKVAKPPPRVWPSRGLGYDLVSLFQAEGQPRELGST